MTGDHFGGVSETALAAAFEAPAAWHALDPGPLDDAPALAARCRDTRIAAADATGPVDARPCLELADLLEIAAGPLDPQVLDYRAVAARLEGRPDDGPLDATTRAALAALHRPPPGYRGEYLEHDAGGLGGMGVAWDREVAVETPLDRIPEVLAKHRTLYGETFGEQLAAPNPDGGAWAPSVVDGLVVLVIDGQLRGDVDLGIRGLDAWRAAASGPRGFALRDDVPALAARCRGRFMRRQLGHAPPAADDAAPCIALADALEPGVGPTHPDVTAARRRALALADPAERAEVQAALDAAWSAPDHPETRRAQARLAALGPPWADSFRDVIIDLNEMYGLDLLDALHQDQAAGLTAEQTAAAIVRRSPAWTRRTDTWIEWIDDMSGLLTPPFSGDAGAWPQELVESLLTVVAIGHRARRPALVFPLMAALDRIADSPGGVDDVPALAARCVDAQLAAMAGRPAPDVTPCERLLMHHEAGLGPAHGWLTLERLRLATLAESRGERVAAARWWGEALDHWADPPTVDSWEEALHTAARVLRSRGHALAAMARPMDGLAALAEGRALAAAANYERVHDGLRFLAEEAELAALAGATDVAAARIRDVIAEMGQARARYAAGAEENDFDPSYTDRDAVALAEVRTLLGLARAFARLDDGPLVADFVAAINSPDRLVDSRVRGNALSGLELDLVVADPDTPGTGRALAATLLGNAEFGLLMDDLQDHPLAITLRAEVAAEQARTDPERAHRAAVGALAMQTVLDRRVRPWEAPAAAAEVARGREMPAVAIAWAKEAVDAVQRARAELGALGVDAERAFVQTHAALYGDLIGLLVEAGRLAEADEIERRLGRITLAGLTRTRRADEAREPVPRIGGEAAWQRALESAAATLRATARRPDAEATYTRALDRMDAALHGASEEAPPAADDVEARLADLGPTALLQVILTADETHLVLSTAAGRAVSTRPVGRARMNRMAHDFYRALREGAPLPEVRRHGAALHAELLAPVEATLDGQGITTLMVAPAGALRYVPFAALVDRAGEFAVTRRAIVRYPTLSTGVFDRPPLRPGCFGRVGPPQPGACIAAFGAREAGGGLSALPFVPAELDGIVRRDPSDLDGAIHGAMYLDRAFTAEALSAALDQRVPIIHIASHFVFHPDASRASFLALGGGARLELDRLDGPDFDFGHVELLALSACETAVGTFAAGQPPDSFSALALQKGARAVLASLWPVADDSTATLMRAFYRHLAAGHSKAAALRQAQLALIEGPAPTGATRKFGLPGVEVESGAHPYAWAPFVLMGDWR